MSSVLSLPLDIALLCSWRSRRAGTRARRAHARFRTSCSTATQATDRHSTAAVTQTRASNTWTPQGTSSLAKISMFFCRRRFRRRFGSILDSIREAFGSNFRSCLDSKRLPEDARMEKCNFQTNIKSMLFFMILPVAGVKKVVILVLIWFESFHMSFTVAFYIGSWVK